MAEDIEYVRRHLAHDKQLVLAGLSMGGYVALEYWSRFGEHLCGLVLCNTNPFTDGPEGKAARLEMASRAVELGTERAIEGLETKLLCEASLQDSQLLDFTLSMMRSVPPPTIAAAQHAMANRRNFEARLREIAIPTLVVTGEQDQLASPEKTKEWSQLLSRGQFEVIPQAGHLTPLENARAFNTLVRDFSRCCHIPVNG